MTIAFAELPASLDGMTQALWDSLTPAQRNLLRDESRLRPELRGHEGWCIEAIAPDDERVRFIVGVSGGWIPVHLEIRRRDSSGGGPVDPDGYTRVRRIERVW